MPASIRDLHAQPLHLRKKHPASLENGLTRKIDRFRNFPHQLNVDIGTLAHSPKCQAVQGGHSCAFSKKLKDRAKESKLAYQASLVSNAWPLAKTLKGIDLSAKQVQQSDYPCKGYHANLVVEFPAASVARMQPIHISAGWDSVLACPRLPDQALPMHQCQLIVRDHSHNKLGKKVGKNPC